MHNLPFDAFLVPVPINITFKPNGSALETDLTSHESLVFIPVILARHAVPIGPAFCATAVFTWF